MAGGPKRQDESCYNKSELVALRNKSELVALNEGDGCKVGRS